MPYDISGKIVAIYPTVQRSETFKTREFAIEVSEDIGGRIITNYVKFQTVQDRVNLLDNFQIGEQVKVHFNIKGSKWTKDGRENYITNLDAWRLERFVAAASAPDMPPTMNPAEMTMPPEADDLPF